MGVGVYKGSQTGRGSGAGRVGGSSQGEGCLHGIRQVSQKHILYQKEFEQFFKNLPLDPNHQLLLIFSTRRQLQRDVKPQDRDTNDSGGRSRMQRKVANTSSSLSVHEKTLFAALQSCRCSGN